MSAFHHVAVVMGGLSAEREISLASGASCAAALREDGRQVTEIVAGYDLSEKLAQAHPDVVFNALHGQWGEDGRVQGLFESMGLPYTHSGVLASALALDKEKAKVLFAAADLPLAESVVVDRLTASRAHIFPPPYVIKPVAQGSSVGVFIVKEGSNAPPSELMAKDWTFGDQVIVERYIAGQEFSCAVLGDRALGIAEILPKAGHFYDYAQKYDENGADHEVPAKVNEDFGAKVKEISCKAHQILGCRGVSRADFRYDKKTNQLVLLEINTQPGMTKMSLVPEIAADAGMDMKMLVRWLVEDASCLR